MALEFEGNCDGYILPSSLPTLSHNHQPLKNAAEIGDGVEYLKFVQIEREQKCFKEEEISVMEIVEISNFDSKENGIFAIELKKEFLSEFAKIKSQLQTKMPVLRKRFPVSNPDKLPHAKDMLAWCAFCLGNKALSQVRSNSLGGMEDEPEYEFDVHGYPPFLRFVLNLNKVNINHLLYFSGIWLRTLGFSPRQGQWIYALLAVIETPLSQKASKALLNLLEICTDIHKGLKPENIDAIIPLEGFIYILEHYFALWSIDDEIRDVDIRFMQSEVAHEDESEDDLDDSESDLDDSDFELN